MALREKIGKLLVINVVVLIVLLILLLFFIQRGGEKESIEDLAERALIEKNIRELYEEATRKPYYEDHPEELEITEIKFRNFRFTKLSGDNKIENPEKEFSQGEPITFSFQVYDYMNPKVEENYYVYGVKILGETRDSEGDVVKSLTAQMADIASHYGIKGLPLIFNMEMIPDSSVAPGEYTLKLSAFDKISGIEQTLEESFTIT
ncbi:hypothetical protein KY345_03610 [Candidatus Woesearchaeota archaeon]|nr:hypothetical protein [Candidatus Woesearchaeota archaeon]